MDKTTPLTTKQIAKHLLLVHEGIKTKEYVCTAGHRTIGVGFNLDAHKLPSFVKPKMLNNGKIVITIDEAVALLDDSLGEHYQDLIDSIPWYTQLDAWRQAALLDMAFNMGVPALIKFKKTLGLIQNQRFAEAALEAKDSKWAKEDVGASRVSTITTIIAKGSLTEEQMRVYAL